MTCKIVNVKEKRMKKRVGNYITVYISMLQKDCRRFSKADRSVSCQLGAIGIPNGVFSNSKNRYARDTGVYDEELGIIKESDYDNIIDEFGLDREKYLFSEADTSADVIQPDESHNDELIEILKSIKESIDMLGKICVQNHIDIGEIKDAWK